MFQLGVIFTAVSVLFLLTELALGAEGQVRHPVRITATLALGLALGVALLLA